MNRFVQDSVYARSDVLAAIGEHRLDGPFVIGEKSVALFVNLGAGQDDPHLEDRSTLRWPRKAPVRVTERDVSTLLFVNAGRDRYRFLGAARAYQYSPGVRDIRDVHFGFAPPLRRESWLALLAARLPPNAPPFPEQEIVRLSAASTVDDCWRALESFVSRWYQPTTDAKRTTTERVGPALLHRLLELASAVPDLFCHNQLVGAEELGIEDGRVTFLVENQAVCLWATEAEGEDPRVWYRNNGVDEPWIEEPVRLSRFIIQAVLFEAALHATFGGFAIDVPPETVAAIRSRLDPVGDDAWNLCGARFYARDGVLAVLMEGEGQWELLLAARTPHALAGFYDLVTDDWDRVAF